MPNLKRLLSTGRQAEHSSEMHKKKDIKLDAINRKILATLHLEGDITNAKLDHLIAFMVWVAPDTPCERVGSEHVSRALRLWPARQRLIPSTLQSPQRPASP